MGRLSTYQCGSSEHIFYFLGNHFVVRGSVDDVPRSAGCFACEYLLNFVFVKRINVIYIVLILFGASWGCCNKGLKIAI